MSLKNWKTTIFGVLAAVIFAIKPDLSPDIAGVLDKVAAVLVAIASILAKDA